MSSLDDEMDGMIDFTVLAEAHGKTASQIIKEKSYYGNKWLILSKSYCNGSFIWLDSKKDQQGGFISFEQF